MTETYTVVNGERRNTKELTFPESGRAFREAWQLDGKIVEVDMASARDIWRDAIRTARTPEFARLDADFMKALETGADTTAIVAQKQELRDAPNHPDIEAAQTPAELMQVQPAGLSVSI